MRTTITLAPDVAAAVQERRREGRGVSDVVNELVRQGLRARQDATPFVQRRRSLGVPLVPLQDVEAALELAEGDAHR